MTATSYTGRCFCESVSYRVEGPPSSLCVCHCESCRRAAGAPCVPWGTFQRKRFSVEHGKLVEYRSSPGVVRGFCGICGTSLTYQHGARPGEIDITLVTVDAPAVLVPEFHIWVRDKLPWLTINDDLPQYDTVQTRDI